MSSKWSRTQRRLSGVTGGRGGEAKGKGGVRTNPHLARHTGNRHSARAMIPHQPQKRRVYEVEFQNDRISLGATKEEKLMAKLGNVAKLLCLIYKMEGPIF